MQAIFHSRQYADDGWVNAYVVELVARDLRASVLVENPGYGHPPTQLLKSLVPCWRGWEGRKRWTAMEGELEIDATSDRTGHITLLLSIPGNDAVPWSAQAKILLEAGQLEEVSAAAEVFFGRCAV